MKFFKLILFIISLIYINTSSINVCLDVSNFSDENFRNMINDIDSILLNGPQQDQIAKAVRLTFHDCVSGCNGCVDNENPDNKGLNCIQANAARIYRKYRKSTFWNNYKLSRADIYALFGYRAIYVSSNFPGLTLPTCEFKIGRKDCTGPQDNKEIFANSIGNWNSISNFYKTEFKFNTQEIVAIMGAHSLGRTWPDNSGFRGPWVAFNNKVFSNTYYQNMLDKDGKLNYKSVVLDKKQQWSSQGDKDARKPMRDVRMMLNVDMCLLKSFNVDQKGVPDCTYQTCKTNQESSEWVQNYANNEPLFKADFSKVYQKMLEHGYENTNTLIDINTNQISPNNSDVYSSDKIIEIIWKSFETAPLMEKFKVYIIIFKKNYDFDSEEAFKRYKIFKKNLKIIQEKNDKVEEESENYGINSYTDKTFEEYFKLKFRIESIHFEEYADLELHKFSHLLVDA